MKRILTLFYLFLFGNGLFAQTLVNQSTLDGAFQQPSQIYSYFKALSLPDGSYGLFYNYFATGGGQDNYFIVHIDSNGNNLGILNYNSLHNGRDLGTNMCVKGNYLYVVGVTTDSAVSSSVLCNTLKLNISTWDTVWTISESIDSPVTQSPFSVAVDDSDNVFVGASVQTPNDFKIALVKYDANGHRQWESNYDTLGFFTLPVAMAFSGRAINVTGYSFDGSGHSNFVTAGFDMHSGSFIGSKNTPNGTGAISHPVNISTDHAALSYVGGTSTVSGVKSVIKVVSYDTLFHQLWMSTWGDSNLTNIAAAMNTDAFVGTGTKIYLTGTTVSSAGNHSMVTIRFSTDGTLDWAKTFNASNPAYPTDGKDVTTDGNGNSFVTGTQYNGTDTDIITVAYDSSGSVLWSKKYNSGAGKNDVPYNIGINDDGSIFVTARSSGVDSQYTMLRYDQWKPTPCGDTICPTITYSFGTGTVTTAGIDTFIEFDIYAKQNEPSLAYYGGNIIFTYGKDVFGNSIVDSNHIVITRGMIISDTNYMYSLKDTIYKSDALPPNGGEVLLSIAPHNSSGLYAIADTFQQLCHVKMKRKSKGSLGIGFDQFYMQNESFFADGAYTFVNTNGRINMPQSSVFVYSITTPILSPTVHPNQIDFDLIAGGSIDMTLAEYKAYIFYNSNAFDSFAISNYRDLGYDGLGQAVYKFSFDTSVAGRLYIAFETDTAFDIGNPDQTADTLIGGVFVAHITMFMKRCDYLPNIYVSPVYSSAQYADPSNLSSFTAYSIDTNHASYNNDGSPMCPYQPYVKGWSPKCTNAGSFEEMTIWGTHFGSDTGTVYFTNADDTTTFIHTLPQDIRHWEDDTIRLLIPSDPTGVGVAASGQFYIKNSNNMDNINDNEQVSIGYANFNFRNGGASLASGNYNTAEFLYLRDTPFVFRLDSFFFYTLDARASIVYVMQEINCETGLNFQVDTLNPSLVNSPNAYDHVNLISLQSHSSTGIFPNSRVLAVTDFTHRTQNCYHGLAQYNNWAYYLNETDISVVDTPYNGKWHWGVSFTSTSTLEDYFAAVIAHELGHVATLCHTRPNGFNIMYPKNNPGDNNFIYSLDPDDILGIRNMLYVGPILGAASGCPADTPVFFSYCGPAPACMERITTTNGIQQITNSSFDAILYPNPYQNNTIVHIEVTGQDNFTISIYNMIGQLIKQKKISSNSSFDVPLSDFNENAGMYLIEVADSYNKKTLKMIKL